MKSLRRLMTALLLLVSIEGYGQYVSIPDSNFGTWLNTNGYASCMTGNNATGWHMDTICSAVVNATSIDCNTSRISDLTGIQYFDHLLFLSCYQNNLTTLPSIPATVVQFNCFLNQITSLPALPNKMQTINCDNNLLTSLPTLPDSLQNFSCFHNQITSLPALPARLNSLICNTNLLTAIPTLPLGLTRLYCDSNHITALPVLPATLTDMICSRNYLTSLPALPNGLQYLICTSNHLNALPALNAVLLSLVCDKNQIASLPALSGSITYLDCSNNLLTSVPTLPWLLNTFVCSNNQLDSLPYLPTTLQNLECKYNQLLKLPALPNALTLINCANNPNLSCLPNIYGSLNYLDFDNCQISCMPNRFVCSNFATNPNTLPLCTGACNGQAGPDQRLCQNSNATMAAFGSGGWYALSTNPASTFIFASSSPGTSITGFTMTGTYSYLWNTGAGSDTMNVLVDSVPAIGILASPDSLTTSGQPITLTASATPTGGTYQWSPLVGITPAAGNTATVMAAPAGSQTYCVTYQVGGCQNSTCQTVYVVSASVGPDQTICQNSIATMAATGTGTWNAISTNPATTTITSPSSATTTISGFTRSGVYSFTWTTGSGTDTIRIAIDSLSGYSVVHNIPCDSTFGSMDLYITSGVAPFRDSLWYFYGTSGPRGPVSTTISSLTTQHYTNLNGFTLYIVDITDALGCTFTVWPTDSVRQTVCLSDSVWPGDADHNGIADNNDLLPIGTAYGLNGFTRSAVSIVWQADYSQNWGVQFLSGTNTKHADCNGDGVINANDTTAILQNFGLTHTKNDGYGAPWRSGIPGITLHYSKDTVIVGDTLITSLLLGDSLTTVSNIYGLAFTFHHDPMVSDSTTGSFGFINSFLGNNSNQISIHKDFRTDGLVKAAVTGINHANRSGYGEIARFSCIITTDNLNGKNLSYYANHSWISDITAIDKDEHIVQLNAGLDSNEVGYIPTGIRESLTTHFSLYPNPASTAVLIRANDDIEEISIIDILGKELQMLKPGNKRAETIDISGLAPAVYIVKISSHGSIGTARLVVAR